MGATEKLAAFLVDTSYHVIPSQVVEKAKGLVLDGLGVSLAGSREPTAQAIADYVKEMGGPPQSTVIGARLRTSPPQAALANGTICHALDYDDVAPDWLGHPTAPVLPTVLALAEARGASGKELLAAYILGVEVESKVGCALGPAQYERGWHSTATMGTIGAAAGAARILGLDVRQTRMALGIAGSLIGGLRQNFGTMTKPLHAGNAARAGVLAALLAQKGFSADENILESAQGLASVLGSDGEYGLEEMALRLGKPFHLASPGVGIKLYPCCSETHRCLDALLYLVCEHGLSAQEVASVECRTSDLAPQILIHPRPRTPLEAKFSMEYCLAAALVEGRLGLAQFTPAKVSNPGTRAVMERVRYLHPPEMRGVSGLNMPHAVTVTLKNGATHSKEVAHARGEAANPLSQEELRDKFRECAGAVLADEGTERTQKLVLALETLDNVAELAEVLAG